MLLSVLFTNFNDNMNRVDFAQIVIMIEFTLIFLIVILSYLLIFLIRFQRKKRLEYSRGIIFYLNQIIDRNGIPPRLKFKKSWKKIELIVPILFTFDKRFNNMLSWKKDRKTFCETILLPIAKKATTRKNWISRFYAAQAFSLHTDIRDEPYILKLLNDPVPLVFYASLESALKNASKNSIIKIVERLSKENWMTKSLFMEMFQSVPTTTRYLIEDVLMGSTIPMFRTTCYNILLQFKMNRLRWDMSKDLDSNFINLRIAALKYIAHTSFKEASFILVLHLKDKSWEVRTICLRLLGEIRAKKAIEPIAACLNDPDWWVRLASATTLRNFGKEGIAILESQQDKIHPDSVNAAYNVLNKL